MFELHMEVVWFNPKSARALMCINPGIFPEANISKPNIIFL